MSQDQERLDTMIRDTARELNDPPATPREAMWAEIDRRRQRQRGQGLRLIVFRPRVWVPAAAAAVLVLGFAIGRLSNGVDETAREMAGTPAGVEETLTSVPTGDLAYRVATAQFLSRTETMLVQFASSGRSPAGDSEITGWARRLLAENRLLIDANVTGDPELTRLLEDLEYVLAQIVMLAEKRQVEETDWIQEGLDQRQILFRVRSQTTAVPGV